MFSIITAISRRRNPLKKCPICKKDPKLQKINHPRNNNVKYWQVICTNDNFNVIKSSKNKAVNAWNRV